MAKTVNVGAVEEMTAQRKSPRHRAVRLRVIGSAIKLALDHATEANGLDGSDEAAEQFLLHRWSYFRGSQSLKAALKWRKANENAVCSSEKIADDQRASSFAITRAAGH